MCFTFQNMCFQISDIAKHGFWHYILYWEWEEDACPANCQKSLRCRSLSVGTEVQAVGTPEKFVLFPLFWKSIFRSFTCFSLLNLYEKEKVFFFGARDNLTVFVSGRTPKCFCPNRSRTRQKCVLFTFFWKSIFRSFTCFSFSIVREGEKKTRTFIFWTHLSDPKCSVREGRRGRRTWRTARRPGVQQQNVF